MMKKAKKVSKNSKTNDNLTGQLNLLLANYQVFYVNLRGFHWNIRGEKFFELHLKFEELYNNIQLKIDEIAERILTVGETPLHTFSDYLNHSVISEAKQISDGRACVKSIVASLNVLLKLQQRLLELSAKEGDEGTNALMSDYIREEEKLLWMFNSWLG